MNTSQLLCCINCDPILHIHVVGVFAANRLPQNRFNRPCGIIVNTDIDSKMGVHWLSIYYDGNGNIEVMDSFGRSPKETSVYDSNWINGRTQTVLFNNIQIQSNESNVCELYCLLFLHRKFLISTLQSFIEVFDTFNTDNNDAYIVDVMSAAVPKCLQSDSNYGQLSVSRVQRFL